MSGQGNDKDGIQPIGDIIKMSDMPKRIKRESRLMLAAGEIHDLTTLERDDVFVLAARARAMRLAAFQSG